MISKGKESDEYDLCKQVWISGYHMIGWQIHDGWSPLHIQCIDHPQALLNMHTEGQTNLEKNPSKRRGNKQGDKGIQDRVTQKIWED